MSPAETAMVARLRAGWKIRREVRWWVPDFLGPVSFSWERPDGAKAEPLSEAEHATMARLGKAKTIGPTSERPGDPPYSLVTLL